MLGFGACQFMFTSDTMFAKAYFTGDEMAPYVAAGTLSRALLWLVLPLATVMFPKIVHAAAKSEKTICSASWCWARRCWRFAARLGCGWSGR
jgi:O-antigen/teichoic acid export membrane protein